ncbi:MAG: DUF4112 domain-containing protein [Myxococcota bacterium]
MPSAVARLEQVFPTLVGADAPRERVSRSIARLESLAWWMDEAIRIPGTSWRMGGDALIGLIPGAGGLMTGAIQTYVITEALRLGIPRRTVAKMLGTVVIDTTIGGIPIVGFVFDVWFKATRRNVTVLLDAVTTPDRPRRR